MSYLVDVRVMVPHSRLCDDGVWIFSSRYTQTGEDVETVCCDRTGRKGNGGLIYLVLRCNEPWHCQATARVRKGALRTFAVDLIEAAS